MKSLLLTAVLDTPWAILPTKLTAIVGLLARHAAGERLSADDVAAVTARPTAPRAPGAVAVLPLFGTLAPRANLMTENSGGTSLERFTQAFRSAVISGDVRAIVLDIDSPGGAVAGVEELAADIYRARGIKPIVAVADHLAASAAYWIATAADEVVMSPSAEVGSIGVFAAHEDVSRALETAGVTTTLISAGKFKTEGNPYEPLSAEARAAMQTRVDEYYTMFTKAVARGRGAKIDDVRAGFGEGRVVGAREALRLGMADRVATLDEVIADLQKPNRAGRGLSADSRGLSVTSRARRFRLATRL